MIFKHVQIRLVEPSGPLICFGSLPDWLRQNFLFILFILCDWKSLAVNKRQLDGEKNQLYKRNYKAALNLTCEYYGDNRFQRQDV